MRPTGIILHHSVCPSINGKGYDFYVTKQGMIIPSPDPTEPERIHICVEGDFSASSRDNMYGESREQLFVLQKLMLRLAETFGFGPGEIAPHANTCPGALFPWAELVISPKDGYH